MPPPVDLDETNTLTASGRLGAPPGEQIPILIVVGGAASLASTRAVIRIEGSLAIGRRPVPGATPSLVLDDALVSRAHARLDVDPKTGRVELVDLGSHNGTAVDGVPLWGTAAPLRSGSLIFIGGHAAVFRFAREADLEDIAQELAEPFAEVGTTFPELAARTRLLRSLAKGDTDLLILGDTGVGKEQYARAIHRVSGRWGKFIAIDCPALPSTLVESELFGFVRGAHSQADRSKLGQIEEAEHGTLFLDEFAEVSDEVQAKFLRFLESREFVALGATKRRSLDVRIIAATNRKLRALRRDLAARLGPDPLRLPLLRERREDIVALCAHFLRRHPDVTFDLPAFQAMCQHPWPDNIRQLKKTVERAAELAEADGQGLIRKEHLGPEAGLERVVSEESRDGVRKGGGGEGEAEEGAQLPVRRRPRRAPGRADLEAMLRRHDWVVAQVAKELQRDHSVVWRWMRRYGMSVPKG